MSEQSVRIGDELRPAYWAATSEAPPEYWPDAYEVPAPARLGESEGGGARDLAAVGERGDAGIDEPVEIDMSIGVGEDPGWQRGGAAGRWKGAARATVRQPT